MINAKEEFLAHITSVNISVLCCGIEIFKSQYPWQDSVVPDVQAALRPGWTAEEFKGFLQALDFNYDNGYGRQMLFGIIWYTDGSWSERYEYDGAEEWQHKQCPELPQEFFRDRKNG